MEKTYYVIKPCPTCKYFEQDKNNKTWCNNVGLWGYRKELEEVVMYCPKYKKQN